MAVKVTLSGVELTFKYAKEMRKRKFRGELHPAIHNTTKNIVVEAPRGAEIWLLTAYEDRHLGDLSMFYVMEDGSIKAADDVNDIVEFKVGPKTTEVTIVKKRYFGLSVTVKHLGTDEMVFFVKPNKK